MLIESDFEQRILKGLACEWRYAVRTGESPYLSRLRQPMFRLADMKRTWGLWSSEKREICLNKKLVFNYSWGAVREVLLHEMAHQVAQEVLVGTHLCHGQESAHGDTFQAACHLLRANPKASGSYPPLDERISDTTSAPVDNLMVRVSKLMALAKSANQHEAQAAMAKAHKLIEKHNLELIESDPCRNFESVMVGRPALVHRGHDYCLANILQDFYFVHCIWVPAFVLEKNKMGRVLEITGALSNLKIASYIHDFVHRYVETAWISYNHANDFSKRQKADFALGIVRGFRLKLEHARCENIKGASQYSCGREASKSHKLDLVQPQDPLLMDHLRYKYPHTRLVRQSSATKCTDQILRDAMRLGEDLVVSKGIVNKGGRTELLIGHIILEQL